ncbi:MAG: hypothetical protein J6B90_12015 [Lachnospiraceae bacterium]|nr:hypothetical protein [Lachnospiraceae bacterium]
MDKIDELLVKYTEEGTITKEAKEFLEAIGTLMVVVVVYGIQAIRYNQYFWQYMIGMIIAILIMIGLNKMYYGLFGLKRWKEKYQKYHRKRFIDNQTRLTEMIKDLGMTNQQVYNLLQKRKALLPPKRDVGVYGISLCSIAIAITNTFVGPLGNAEGINYASYVAVAIVVFFCCGVGVVVGGDIIIALSKSQEVSFLEKYNCEYVVKLLEDLLY